VTQFCHWHDFPLLQRSDFNRAVGDSINSVHKMCTNEDYKMGESTLACTPCNSIGHQLQEFRQLFLLLTWQSPADGVCCLTLGLLCNGRPRRVFLAPQWPLSGWRALLRHSGRQKRPQYRHIYVLWLPVIPVTSYHCFKLTSLLTFKLSAVCVIHNSALYPCWGVLDQKSYITILREQMCHKKHIRVIFRQKYSKYHCNVLYMSLEFPCTVHSSPREQGENNL
jgi:hypothetical protein